MHDPDVVAFDICRPWPKRSRWHDAKEGQRRWALRRRHTCHNCEHHEPGKPPTFPWWRAGSYSRFSVVAGRGFYWPSMVTVWHHEPGGADSFTVCKHHVRDADGRFVRYSNAWRWHVRHWHIQLCFARAIRRRLLTRCAGCGGRSVKGNQVNCSMSWDTPRGHWWQGEPNLYHSRCTSTALAAALAVVEQETTRSQED